MIFEQIPLGGNRNFGYLFGDPDSRIAIAFDPAYVPKKFEQRAKELGLEIRFIANTHSDPDHVNGNERLQKWTGAQVWIHEASKFKGARLLRDGEAARIGQTELLTIHTPGHTPDSVCFLLNDTTLVSGDTLFVGKVGGTGTDEAARQEYDSLQRILKLPDHVTVWPGHDFGARPSSTIGEERRTNPFLTQPDFESFLHLKKNWLAYKEEHGIA